MDKHTPGPWKAEEIAGQIHIGSEPDDDTYVFGQNICDMVQSIARGRKDAKRIEHDAYLIAAAPEMLAVLRDLEWLGLNDGRGVTHQQCPACSALKSRGTGHNPYCGLAAAIAKAEGK